MSITFRASVVDLSRPGGTRVVYAPCEDDDIIGFNLANGNARAFLQLLQLPAEDLCDRAGIRLMAEAVQRARASFDYRVDAVTRPTTEQVGPNGATFITMGVNEAYFTRRLAEFAELLADWIELGAHFVEWG